MSVHSAGIIIESIGANQPPTRQGRQGRKSIFLRQVIIGFFRAILASGDGFQQYCLRLKTLSGLKALEL
jgi:hypothetical protein